MARVFLREISERSFLCNEEICQIIIGIYNENVAICIRNRLWYDCTSRKVIFVKNNWKMNYYIICKLKF